MAPPVSSTSLSTPLSAASSHERLHSTPPSTLRNTVTSTEAPIVHIQVRGSGSPSVAPPPSLSTTTASQSTASSTYLATNALQPEADDDALVTVLVTPRRIRTTLFSVDADNEVSSVNRTSGSTVFSTNDTRSTHADNRQPIVNNDQNTTSTFAPISGDVVRSSAPRPPALKPLVRRPSAVAAQTIAVIDLTNTQSSNVDDNNSAVGDFPSYTSSPPRLTAALKAEYAVYEQLALTQYAALEPSWHKQLESLRRSASPSRSGNSQLRDIQFPVFGKLRKATCSRVGYRYQAIELPDVLTVQQQNGEDEMVRSLMVEGFPRDLNANDMLLQPSFPIPADFIPRKRQKVHAVNAASEPVAVKKIGRLPTDLLSETAIRAEMNHIRETDGAAAATRSRAVKNLRDRQEDVVVAPLDEKRVSRRSTQMASIASKQQTVPPSPSKKSLKSPLKPDLHTVIAPTATSSAAPRSRFVTNLEDMLVSTPKAQRNKAFTVPEPIAQQVAVTSSHTTPAVKSFTPMLAKLSRRPSTTSDTTADSSTTATASRPTVEVPPLPDPSVFANLHRNNDDVPHRLQEYLRSFIVSQSLVKLPESCNIV